MTNLRPFFPFGGLQVWCPSALLTKCIGFHDAFNNSINSFLEMSVVFEIDSISVLGTLDFVINGTDDAFFWSNATWLHACCILYLF